VIIRARHVSRIGQPWVAAFQPCATISACASCRTTWMQAATRQFRFRSSHAMSQSAHPNHCKGTCDLTIDSEWGSTPAQGIIPFWENGSCGRDRTLPARLVFALGGANLVCTNIGKHHSHRQTALRRHHSRDASNRQTWSIDCVWTQNQLPMRRRLCLDCAECFLLRIPVHTRCHRIAQFTNKSSITADYSRPHSRKPSIVPRPGFRLPSPS
jgi:hypothetical protein